MFGHIPIAFDDRVLRPRPWTVAQSRWAAELLVTEPTPATVLELCAGVGHIGLLALAMADALPVRLVMVDVNAAACELARRNAEAIGVAGRVEVREGRIDEALALHERFELVVADPPWVPRAETHRFPDDPLLAIDGGDDGLDIARTCLRVSESHLAPGGSVLLQLGSNDQVLHLHDHLSTSGSALSVQEVRDFGSHGVLMHLTTGAT